MIFVLRYMVIQDWVIGEMFLCHKHKAYDSNKKFHSLLLRKPLQIEPLHLHLAWHDDLGHT